MTALSITDAEVRDYAVSLGLAKSSEEVDRVTFRAVKKALAEARINAARKPVGPAEDTPPEQVITVAVEVSLGGRVVGAHAVHVPLPEGNTTA